MSEIPQSNDPKYPLFAFMHDEYGFTLLDSELQAIIDACGKCTPTPSADVMSAEEWADSLPSLDVTNMFKFAQDYAAYVQQQNSVDWDELQLDWEEFSEIPIHGMNEVFNWFKSKLSNKTI